MCDDAETVADLEPAGCSPGGERKTLQNVAIGILTNLSLFLHTAYRYIRCYFRPFRIKFKEYRVLSEHSVCNFLFFCIFSDAY